MPPLDTASMAIEQQAMGLHHPIDPLVIVHPHKALGYRSPREFIAAHGTP
jgi:hypothetical protein